MCDNFCHLHVHSEYSMLDGLGSPETMIERAVELGQPGLAITDHGNLHGVVEFYRSAKEHNIIPVIGLEGYIARFGATMYEKDSSNRESFHQLLLAETQEGYQNLIYLSSIASIDGFYNKPKMDFNVLEKYSRGIITTTGCMAAPIPRAIQANADQSEIYALFDWYISIFGRDNFYVEIQDHIGIPELVEINKQLIKYAKHFNLKILPTNDAHYARPTDAPTHDVLLCVQTRSYVNQSQRMRFTDNEYYLKSRSEMEKAISQYNIDPAYLDLTVEIMERCKGLDLESKEKHHMPNIAISDMAQDYDQELDFRARSKLDEMFDNKWSEEYERYRDRFYEELRVINKTGFSVYYLIISDICNFARANNILWNVRGSGAGSLVSYVLGMSFVDPLKYDLLFERFINEFRVTMPDFDMDFPDDMRETIIRYLREKYGDERVAQIVTFGRMKARMCVRDVTRALGWSQNEIDALANKILNTPGKPITIKNSLDATSEYYSVNLREAYDNDENIKDALDTSEQLEKTVRHSGIHAAAVAIADKDLIEYVPLMRPPAIASTKYVTQFDYPTLESLGILKVDILGLATLSIIRKCIELVKERHGVQLSYYTIPFDGPEIEKSMALLQSGEVMGVFQVESYGLRTTLTRLKPTTFQHIMDVISLYRPGPLEYIPDYIAGVNEGRAMTLPHDDLAEILNSTQGIIIYQEQIIKILQKMGGYSPGEADLVRKTISKKEVEKMEKEKKVFLDKTKIMGYNEDEALKVFNDIERFALYGFNLAHAASYARITMITAWLKSHYPVEYITACLMTEWNKPEKVSGYILEARRMGIPVLSPDINKSKLGFSIDDDSGATITSYSKYQYDIPVGVAIRFGLESIKQVGKSSAESLTYLAGQIRTIDDILRINLEHFNSRSLRRLIGAGTFDSVAERSLLIGNEERIMQHGVKAQDIYLRGQYSLITPELILEPMEEGEVNLYNEEKESLGVWITKHPIEDYYNRLYDIITHTILDLTTEDSEEVDSATMVLVVDKIKDITSSTGKPMSFVTFSDLYGTIEAILFPKAVEYRPRLIEDQIVVVVAKVSHYREEPSLIIQSVYESVQVIPTQTQSRNEQAIDDLVYFVKIFTEDRETAENFVRNWSTSNQTNNLLVRVFSTKGEPLGAIRRKNYGISLETLKKSKLRYVLD